MKTSLFMALLIIGTALAVPRTTQRIVGGQDTTIQTYPFMASILYTWFGIASFQACGGALLTSTTVLSAAHCYEAELVPAFWRVQLGSSLPASGGGVVMHIAQIVLHDQFRATTLDNDVAIIRLASSVTLGPSIAIAMIAGPSYILPDNTPVVAVGWGDLWHGGPSASILQHVEVYTINWDVCAERYAQLKTQPGFTSWPDLTPGMVCSGVLNVGGRDACQGDSGGPVVHNGNVVYGVSSWGFECANGTYPGVNANVPFYADWIIANGSS